MIFLYSAYMFGSSILHQAVSAAKTSVIGDIRKTLENFTQRCLLLLRRDNLILASLRQSHFDDRLGRDFDGSFCGRFGALALPQRTVETLCAARSISAAIGHAVLEIGSLVDRNPL